MEHLSIAERYEQVCKENNALRKNIDRLTRTNLRLAMENESLRAAGRISRQMYESEKVLYEHLARKLKRYEPGAQDTADGFDNAHT